MNVVGYYRAAILEAQAKRARSALPRDNSLTSATLRAVAWEEVAARIAWGICWSLSRPGGLTTAADREDNARDLEAWRRADERASAIRVRMLAH